jgi:IMP dehydrogenase/GMP reductase
MTFFDALQAAGVPQDKAKDAAEKIDQSFKQAFDSQSIIHAKTLATKEDIAQVRTDMEKMRGELKAEIAPLKWGITVSTAGIIALLLKAYVG